MASSSRNKAADRQALLKKLLPVLKKQYKVTIPKLDRPVMETMLYAVCLENSTVEQADAAYQRFCQAFPDLNEARVSSIGEIEPVFADCDGVAWRAFRTRAILQYVFDKTYNFEFESLRKKTLELATKQLARIKHLSPFVRSFTLQQVIGAHILPLDDYSTRALVWLGLGTSDQNHDEMGESLKSLVRKAEAHQFCFSLRCLAADPKLKAAFDPQLYPHPEEGYDAGTAMDRLTQLFKKGPAALKPAPAPTSSEKGEKAAKDKGSTAKAPAAKAAAKAPAAAKTAPASPKKPAAKAEAKTSAKSAPTKAKSPAKKAKS